MKAPIATALAMAVTGCASIVSESKYPVSVSSHPNGATFEVRNEKGSVVSSGVTPGVVMLDAGGGYFDGETYTFTYRKDGHVSQAAILDSEIDGMYWGNLLWFGGLIGLLVVDPATGAMYKLPSYVGANLIPVAEEAKQELPEVLGSKKSKEQLLEDLSNNKDISYDEYRRRHEILMRSN